LGEHRVRNAGVVGSSPMPSTKSVPDRMSKDLTLEQQLEKMRADWDARARENARHYVATGQTDWSDEEFFRSGEQAVSEDLLTDMTNVCQGKEPRAMRVLEIGCGAGRLTRALAKMFGEVHAVDVSGEMVERARQALAAFSNAHVYQNNGCDLTVVPPLEFDFAYSSIVFQHIPSYQVIESYVREVSRLLRPGALFKFQVQGYTRIEAAPDDTWLGVSFSDEAARQMAYRCGFEPRYSHGSGGQYFWLWFFKRA
jgi:cyclopropane fatty-acyl-phospholipid synthase-like methyltransferase